MAKRKQAVARKKASPKTASRKKSAIKKTLAKGKKKAAKRELIDTGRDKRYVRRDVQGQFNESDDVGKSLAQDRRRKAKTPAKAGQGDTGDRRQKAR